MKKYRKKPIVVEVEQWNGYFDHIVTPHSDRKEYPNAHGLCFICHIELLEHGFIHTLEGEHIVCPGDWIVKGIKGEYYPVKPNIFKETYEKIID